MKKVVLLGCLFLIPLTLASETQRRFRIAVHVFEGKDGDKQDIYIKKILQTNFEREFNLLEDVDVVQIHENWHFEFEIICLQNQYTNGLRTGILSIADGFYERVPQTYFKADQYPAMFRVPVFPHHLGVGSSRISQLDQYCIQRVAEIDKEVLTPKRILFKELFQ